MKKKTAMKKYSSFLLLMPFILVACSAPKTYFTSAIRSQVESSHQPLEKIQFYTDREIVLRRDLRTGETKVSSGKVRIKNGHYVNIITLKKNTPGVCTMVRNNAIGVSFETGENKFLTFGKTKNARPNDPYRILANEWVEDYGVVNYEGEKYHIQPSGTEAGIMIKTHVLKKYKLAERKVKGRTVKDSKADKLETK
jgi:hypothetical protein